MNTKSEKEREKKDKRFSIIMSAIVHGSLLLIFLLLVAWRQPDPPNTLPGLTFNLGVDDQGFGNTESEVESPTEETDNTTPPESENETEETQEPEVTPDEVVEETPPVTEPVEETKPVEAPKEAITEPVTEKTAEATETQETESDVKVEEKKPVEETKKEETKEEVTPVEEKKKEDEKKPEPKPDPVVNKQALLGAKKSDTNSKDPASSNQGDKIDTRGQMGKTDGDANTNGQATDGGNLGVSLSLDGWAWDRAPSGKDDSEIDGVILFQIKVDDRGVVREVTKMPGTTISDNTVVEFYKKEVQKLSFKRTVGAQAAPISVGEIKFIIKTK
jgi:outer membrane biosynthesis protein TonB